MKPTLMGFEIYNKLDSPLYIDWRKSSYIDNSVKLNYWEDVERISGLHATYYYESQQYKTSTKGVSVSTKVKQERITFIPPKSKYQRSQFYILPISFHSLDKKGPYTEEKLREGSPRITKVYYMEFSKEASPLVFRNFLTFSLTEDFKDEFYVDNEFYISKILELDEASFFQRAGYGNTPRHTRTAEYYEKLPYRDRRSFFIKLKN